MFLTAQPLLPNSHQPKQNWADSVTPTIHVNPTQISEQMNHPVVHTYYFQQNTCMYYEVYIREEFLYL